MATKDKKRPSYITKEKTDTPQPEGGGFPAVKLLQAISPECAKGDEKFIKGAEAGMLIHTETSEMFDGEEGLDFIPLQARKTYVEWIPRSQGGGFVAEYKTREEAEENKEPKNEIAVTIEYACFFPELDKVALIRFDSPTKLGPARTLGKLIEEAETMAGRTYRLSTVRKKNAANQSYYNFKIEGGDWTSKKLYNQTETLLAIVKQGQIGYASDDEESEI